MEHEHMLSLLNICAEERNLKTRRKGWEKIRQHLNEQLRTNYPTGVLTTEYYNQYSLCKDYHTLRNEGFNIESENDQHWDNIYRTVPGARAVRANTICVPNWIEVFGLHPNLPMNNFHRESIGAMELMLWKPSEGGESTTGGNSRVSGGSSHNSQTVNLCRHGGDSSSPNMRARLNAAANRIRELMGKGLPRKFYVLAVDHLGKNLHYCEWVMAQNDGELVEWLLAKPDQLPEFNNWFEAMNPTI